MPLEPWELRNESESKGESTSESFLAALGPPRRSSGDEWELDWRKRDGRAFLATRLSRTMTGAESFKSESDVLRKKEHI